MRISAISDVHVKSPHDPADKLLVAFLEHPLVQNSEYVLLLGDIFDLMCGPHPEYISSYDHIFKKIEGLRKSGRKVLYFEGNHDVHLQKLFSIYWPQKEVSPEQGPLILDIDGKSYYVSHGDEHEVDNIAYQRYKKFILSPPLRFVADHLMPYALLNFLGERASKQSRKKGAYMFDEEKVRLRFRRGVETTTMGKFDFVLGGHSHVQEIYKFPNGRSTYVNNGYALRSKTFITIDDHQVSFEPLAV